jgi:hypothetical protein
MEEQLSPKINLEELYIEIISTMHEVNNFKSYESELVDFLVEDALDNQNKQLSITYLWFLKSTKELIAYVTVLADAISLQGEMNEYFKQKWL